MKDHCSKCLPAPSKSWSQRLLGFFQAGACSCSKGASCPDDECSCSGNEMCTMKDWCPLDAEADDTVAVAEPDRPTLSTVPVGGKAHVEQIFLPLAQKKRLLSLGLTCGTKIGVISNEKGRMIVAVRDSRLGLSPEVASRITYKAAG